MYQFRITRQESGGYRFEYNGIKILVDDYIICDDRHIIKTPAKAIGYFDVENYIYGVMNEPVHFTSAEEFHDAMRIQFMALK